MCHIWLSQTITTPLTKPFAHPRLDGKHIINSIIELEKNLHGYAHGIGKMQIPPFQINSCGWHALPMESFNKTTNFVEQL